MVSNFGSTWSHYHACSCRKVFTADEVADTIVGILDKLNVKEACVVGHSYGEHLSGDSSAMALLGPLLHLLQVQLSVVQLHVALSAKLPEMSCQLLPYRRNLHRWYACTQPSQARAYLVPHRPSLLWHVHATSVAQLPLQETSAQGLVTPSVSTVEPVPTTKPAAWPNS